MARLMEKLKPGVLKKSDFEDEANDVESVKHMQGQVSSMLRANAKARKQQKQQKQQATKTGPRGEDSLLCQDCCSQEEAPLAEACHACATNKTKETNTHKGNHLLMCLLRR